MIKTALISVSNKQGVVEFAQKLAGLGIKIISTGGTAKQLREAGIEVVPISEVTGFPEIMDGRVKTLHPKVHGGILAIRDLPSHQKQMAEHGIQGIDLVAVNLYPFRETIAKPGVELAEVIENIDIGGPTMVRSAAKNYKHVAVVVNPEHYNEVVKELENNNGEISESLRFQLAVEAFGHTSGYDTAIYNYLRQLLPEAEKFPAQFSLSYQKVQDLRYGENPHQAAAFYREDRPDCGLSLADAKQMHGKELSYNNILDLNAALGLVAEFDQPAAVIIKHTNPCGVAQRDTLAEAYRSAFAGDPVSAFGSVISFNRVVDRETAEELSKTFVEAVIAPSFSGEALAILTDKKNIRLLCLPQLDGSQVDSGLDYRRVAGGLLVQEVDLFKAVPENWQVVTKRKPTDEELDDLFFAWKVTKHVKSNAIVMVKNKMALGVGAGQMSRVDSTKIAAEKAGEKSTGSVIGSDAFFPFRDGIDLAGLAGVSAIIQPGGSIRDEEVINAANEHGIAMVFTGERHFRH
jgi:phosphoribosylaminoimidazolecarboxamide formyltransferase/IMP cyclohydrolase